MVPTLVAMLALVLTGTPVAQAGGGKGPLGPDAFMLMAGPVGSPRAGHRGVP
jgi:hypothetical protein